MSNSASKAGFGPLSTGVFLAIACALLHGSNPSPEPRCSILSPEPATRVLARRWGWVIFGSASPPAVDRLGVGKPMTIERLTIVRHALKEVSIPA